jgi:hypothetical protein
VEPHATLALLPIQLPVKQREKKEMLPFFNFKFLSCPSLYTRKIKDKIDLLNVF